MDTNLMNNSLTGEVLARAGVTNQLAKRSHMCKRRHAR